VSNNLFMQKLAELENQYILDKQALREARLDIQKAEAFAAQHNASAVVCIHNGTAEVWVQVWRKLFVMLAVEKGVLSEDSIAGKTVYIVDGVKVILNDY
jgi:hypothetical protein